MKIKLDENLGRRIEQLFEKAGHEVATVHAEGPARPVMTRWQMLRGGKIAAS